MKKSWKTIGYGKNSWTIQFFIHQDINSVEVYNLGLMAVPSVNLIFLDVMLIYLVAILKSWLRCFVKIALVIFI